MKINDVKQKDLSITHKHLEDQFSFNIWLFDIQQSVVYLG